MPNISKITTKNATFLLKDAEARASKINLPSGNTYGTAGQLLRTKGDGTTEWVDYGLPTDEQTELAVNRWLDSNPELTTTVLDGEIGRAKLNADLQEKTDAVPIVKSTVEDNGLAVPITEGWNDGQRMYIGKYIGAKAGANNEANVPSTNSGWRYIRIQCNPGEYFVINAQCGAASNYRVWCFTDSSYTILDMDDGYGAINEEIVAPEGAAYLYINQNADRGTCYKGRYVSAELAEQRATHFWRGKKIVIFGDSRTWYDGQKYSSTCKDELSGDVCVGYQEQIRKLLGAETINEGVSSETSIDICSRVLEYDFTGVDAVFLAGGVNDFVLTSRAVQDGALVSIGSDFNTNTAYGAWQSAVEYILTNYPQVQIYMDVPPIAWTEAGVYPYARASVKSKVSELYNIPCVDLYKDCGINEINRDYYYADDVTETNWRLHFNDRGNEIIGLIIAKFIEAHYTQPTIPDTSELENDVNLLEARVDGFGSPIDTLHNHSESILALIAGTNEQNDLDLYTTAGTYRITTVAIAKAIKNCPAEVGGRLIVMNLSESNSKLQIYLANSGKLFTRKYTYNNSTATPTWTTWASMATGSDLSAVSASIDSKIGALDIPFSTSQAHNTVVQLNDDFDDYTSPGNYRVATNEVAKTLGHKPIAKSGRLTVINTSENAAKMQLYFANKAGIYFRMGTTADGYGDWLKLATMVDIPSEPIDAGDEAEEPESTEETSLVIDPVKIKGTYNLLAAVRKQTSYNIAYANALTPLPLKNYLGNTENVHPKVLYFENGFGGHNYWMAYTPYPASNDNYENPCIAYSDDGYEWTDYAQNPLDAPSDLENTYYSDTHLVYREDTNELECWYRFVDETGNDSSNYKEIIYRRRTTDGVTWTAKELVTEHTGPVTRYLSPAIIWDNTTKFYRIWAVHGSAYGNNPGITYFTASANSLSNWNEVRDYALTFDDDGLTVNPWHMDVIRAAVGNETKYMMLVMCRKGSNTAGNKCSLFITTSDDNIVYSTPVKVVGGADNWDKFMYRSCIVKVGNKFRIYYSAGTGSKTSIYGPYSKWGLGITETENDTTPLNFYGRFE